MEGSLPGWHPHWDVWAVLGGLLLVYFYAEQRLRSLVAPTSAPATLAQRGRFLSGVLLLWVVSDWPIHDLAEQALFSLHMVEHIVIVYVTPPLLLTGIPRWMADRTLGHPRLLPVIRSLTAPVVAFAIFNLLLVGLHAPAPVGWMISNTWVHAGLHLVLFAAALLAWVPIFSPTPRLGILRPPLRMLYLFAQTLLPTIPASFLTFSKVPIYPDYGLAAWEYGIDPVTDQTVSGLIMKLGGGLLLFGILLGVWYRWIGEERRWDEIEREFSRPAPPSTDRSPKVSSSAG